MFISQEQVEFFSNATLSPVNDYGALSDKPLAHESIFVSTFSIFSNLHFISLFHGQLQRVCFRTKTSLYPCIFVEFQ